MSTLRACSTRPTLLPLHVGHFFLITLPLPAHRGHGCCTCCTKPGASCTRCVTCPRPLHALHSWKSALDAAPVPRHFLHRRCLLMRTVCDAPEYTSSRVHSSTISTFGVRS